MAQSLSRICLHIIFHTNTNSPLLQTEHLERVHQYIGGLINQNNCQVLCVGGTENHVHALLVFSRTETVAHVVEEIKRNSSRWIKTLSSAYNKFAWQGGYAAFSVSQSQIKVVEDYIKGQQQHHKKQSFRDEYLQFLHLHKIDYEERYVLSD